MMAAPLIVKVVSDRGFSLVKQPGHLLKQFSRYMGKSTLNNFKGKKGSKIWMTRQINDPYVKLSKTENFRCRSAYKLIEIDDRYHILKEGNTVIDCGASPGSWSQVAANRVNASTGGSPDFGKVISIDLQHIEPLDNVIILGETDFTHAITQTKIQDCLNGEQADVVLSDMAPNSTGNKHLDHHNICELTMSVLKFSSTALAQGGHILCKIWDGQNREKLLSVMERMFQNVYIVKPASSRSGSAELFLLGMTYKLHQKVA